MPAVTDRLIALEHLRLNVRQWPGDKRPFLLVHGLASNARTWDAVAARLAAAGHPVTAVDQRGHGRSDKPASGYDFASVTADLNQLLDALGTTRPYLLGQSWGGNVALAFGAAYPGRAAALGFVDGGTIDFQSLPDATWEQIAAWLRPPDLTGTPRAQLAAMIRAAHPDWSDAGVEATLHNFETLPDGTVRPWLSLDHHMAILRAMWEMRPATFYPLIHEPVLLVNAEDGDAERVARKRQRSAEAVGALAAVREIWLPDTDHDIHVQRPDLLAGLLLDAIAGGFWPE